MFHTNPCVECGIPMVIHDTGYILIKGNSVSTLFDQMNIEYEVKQDKVIYYYSSRDVLKTLMDNLFHHVDNMSHFQASIHQSKDSLKYNLIPLLHLYERIVNERIVTFIQKGEFISYIQPIIDLNKHHQLYGYESLLRSADPSENIYPSEIFSVAEKTGLKSMLDQRAREEAIKSRLNKISPGVKSFINFLPSTIYNPEYCLRHTFAIVEKYNVNPSDLVFEVVETEKIDDVEHLKNILRTYKNSGMKVALDDVGAGYSTINMLTELKPDYVKIDREYISFCDQDSRKQAFLDQVISITKQLGIIVLGEGIERKEELDYCKHIGMDLAQGYYIGKPSPEAANIPSMI
ncbi:EAL domain-containing protein [Litchfieldia salsa]|uniref:EAL domain, c-di-GMP-specific phosphodiesterase class I (Or its enzymatically inactive variant) n=1 Tax=Litchfieldia salsa TaxID=930152 RepID=A0A1H0P8W7_9BACI|nr:EAL domain-containing protein [Litchfieldia salsa]SDP01128.1 EAL domain, c-di-GMP-specific phosphodiesterase class I (or its enzymatically inactive variant) [Litchfieldia salsa]